MKFVVIGGGWRSEFYMRLAQKMPDRFNLTAVVTIDPKQAVYYSAAPWHMTCVPTLATALTIDRPDFVVVCVPHTVATSVILDVLNQGLAVLSETPVASDLADLRRLAAQLPKTARFQVAEQYHLRPDMVTRLACIAQGKIGIPQVALVSLTNNYHAISLMRQFLRVSGSETKIRAQRFQVSGQPGFERNGVVQSETFRFYDQTLATFDFGQGKQGIYNFEGDQHRSFIRSQHIQIKGNRGELNDHDLRYLKDFRTPIVSHIKRMNKGEYENMEGFGLKGIVLEDDWLYHNPFPEAALSDDEIALGTCLEKMAAYCQGGNDFYSFAQAAQDFYLTLLIEEAVVSGQTISTVTQPWTATLLAEYASR